MADAIFSHSEYETILTNTLEEIRKLGKLKGGEYAGDTDRLANFRRNGRQLDLPMEVIWAVYYNKHHDSVMQFIQDLKDGKKRDRLESIGGRVDDMLTYLTLFKCMLAERERAYAPPAPGLFDPTPERERPIPGRYTENAMPALGKYEVVHGTIQMASLYANAD